MNSITHSLECALTYISAAFLQQSHEEMNQDESTCPSSQAVAVSLLAAAVGAYAIKRLISMAHQRIEDTPKLFWKELERNQRPPLSLGPVVVMGEVIAEDLSTLQKKMFFFVKGCRNYLLNTCK